MTNTIQGQVSTYSTMDLGSGKAISVPMQTVEVVIATDYVAGDYVKGFITEAYRVNPLRMEQIKLTDKELKDYLDFLLTQRIHAIHGTCSIWNKLKSLYIPSYFQYVLSMIGEVYDREYGLHFIPVMDRESKMTYEKAYEVSEKLGSLSHDLQIVQDAMPRGSEGNINVMGSAIIAEYVRSYRYIDHPSFTYVTAFLNMKLKEELAFQVLYRVQYDDVSFIHTVLSREKGIY